jgi:ribonuclease G
VLVQIFKNVHKRSPDLPAEISLPGRYVVVTPFTNIVVSRKCKFPQELNIAFTKERNYRSLIKADNLGVIVRTAAEGHACS